MKKTCVILLMLLLMFTAVQADDLADVKQAGELVFGVSPDYIPFVFYNQSGSLTGIDVALMEEVARRMQVELRTVDVAFDGILDALNIDQVDVIGGALSKTAERQELIDFTRIYYSGDAQFIGLSTLSIADPSSYESFRDLKIGVQKGTSFDQWVKTNLVSAGYADIRNVFAYSAAADEMRALDRKAVDLVLMDQDLYEQLYKSSGKYRTFYEGITKENYAFGMRKNSTLTTVISGHLTDMLKDGTAQTIANRFFQMNFNEVEVTIARSSQLPQVDLVPVPTAVPVTVPTANTLPAGTDYMTFAADVTITDGHEVKPGERFRKTWRVKNTGNTTWTPYYSFVYVSGDRMEGRDINIPTTVYPGQTVELSVDLVAPKDKGTYRGYWQMRTPYGYNFGETIWFDIIVSASSGSSDQKVQTTPKILKWYPAFYTTDNGGCPRIYYEVTDAYQVEFYINNSFAFSSRNLSGYTFLCTPKKAGTYTLAIRAVGETAISDAFQFVDQTYYPPENIGKPAEYPHPTLKKNN